MMNNERLSPEREMAEDLMAITIEKAPLQTKLVARHKNGYPLIVEILETGKGKERAVYPCGKAPWPKPEDLTDLWLLEERERTDETGGIPR